MLFFKKGDIMEGLTLNQQQPTSEECLYITNGQIFIHMEKGIK